MARSAVWPFETGLEPLPPANQRKWSILYAEIYPGTFEIKARENDIKDEVQVRTWVEGFMKQDENGALRDWFAAPKDITEKQLRNIVNEEGWILGVR
jgi:hypothetical protein